MKTKICLCGSVLSIAAIIFVGCKKESASGSREEPKITGSPSDAPISLVPKWAPGKRYVMRMESMQSMDMPDLGGGGAADGKNAPMENNFVQEYSLNVTNAGGGNRGLEVEILAVQLETGRGEQMTSYDSRNQVAPGNNPIGGMFDRLIGAKIYCLVSPENKVLKVEGIDDLLARVEVPDAPNDRGARRAGRNAGAAMLRGLYSDELFKQMIEFSGAPREPVRIGESWVINREVAAPNVGRLIVSMTNTLRGWQEHEGKKCARIDFTGSMASKKNDDAGADATPVRVSIEDGIVSGHYWFDPEWGGPIETAIDQNYTVHAGGVPAGKKADGTPRPALTFEAPVHQTVTMKLLEMKDAETR
jgi:hypothetical protein